MPQKIGYRHSKETKRKISEAMRKHHQKYDKIGDEEKLDILKLYNSKTIPIAIIAKMYNITEKHLFTLIKMMEELEENDE